MFIAAQSFKPFQALIRHQTIWGEIVTEKLDENEQNMFYIGPSFATDALQRAPSGGKICN